jgi:hypothetical protein
MSDTTCGVVANLAVNIVWVITIKCAGHNSHGSGCSSPNSQVITFTTPTGPYLFIYFFLFIFTTQEAR